MLRLGEMEVIYIDENGKKHSEIGDVIVNNDIISIDENRILIFKEKIVVIRRVKHNE